MSARNLDGCHYCGALDVRDAPEPFDGKSCCERCFDLLTVAAALERRPPFGNADKQRAYRDRRRGGPPRQPKPCGTLAAVRRHQRRGEPLDAACREAYNAEQRRLYAQRRR